MKTISLILFGSILTIGLQFIDIKNIYFISNADAAGNNKPCRVIKDLEDDINNLFRVGYRVKGVGSSTGNYGVVVMCKG